MAHSLETLVIRHTHRLPGFEEVEENQVSVSKVVRAVVEHDYLTVRDLIGLMPGGMTAVDLLGRRTGPGRTRDVHRSRTP